VSNGTEPLKAELVVVLFAGRAMRRTRPPTEGFISLGLTGASAGVGKLGVSILGLQKLIPIFTSFAKWITYTAGFVKLLAVEEGIAAAASYVFGRALAVLTAPITLTIGALGAVAGAMYAFRDSTFTAKGEVSPASDTPIIRTALVTSFQR
jgi:hypothetical protein